MGAPVEHSGAAEIFVRGRVDQGGCGGGRDQDEIGH